MDCHISGVKGNILVQVCNFDLAGKEGYVIRYKDAPDEVTGEEFKLTIKQVNCEKT